MSLRCEHTHAHTHIIGIYTHIMMMTDHSLFMKIPITIIGYMTIIIMIKNKNE